MKPIHMTTIKFPEIQLQTRDAHKLRGYFGHLFQAHSPLLHNHYENGAFRHRYPLVQYKVLHGTPTLVALEEGADLLTSLFLKIKEIRIGDTLYAIHTKNIVSRQVAVGYTDELIAYGFQTLWMALNQENYKTYISQDVKTQAAMLNKIIIGHILSFFKHMNLFLPPEHRLIAKTHTMPKKVRFKNQPMMAFAGSFLVNAVLPEDVGIGKAVSRGFGTIKKVD